MREILFRGKRKDNGEWVKGSFWDESPGELGGIAQYGSCVFHHVDLVTVGQFTGLTDKNGKRIFEGDIIRAKIEGGNHDGFTWPNMPVDFQQGCFCVNDRNGYVFAVLGAFATSVTFEIIGNIHDNPELLKGGVS